MTLHNELQQIHGIGEAKAEAIEAVLTEHGRPSIDEEEIDHAIDQARRGNEKPVIEFLETLRGGADA